MGFSLGGYALGGYDMSGLYGLGTREGALKAAQHKKVKSMLAKQGVQVDKSSAPELFRTNKDEYERLLSSYVAPVRLTKKGTPRIKKEMTEAQIERKEHNKIVNKLITKLRNYHLALREATHGQMTNNEKKEFRKQIRKAVKEQVLEDLQG